MYLLETVRHEITVFMNEPKSNEESSAHQEQKVESSAVGIWMSLGMSFGVAFGAVFNNVAIGLCLGMSVGICIGSAIDAQA